MFLYLSNRSWQLLHHAVTLPVCLSNCWTQLTVVAPPMDCRGLCSLSMCGPHRSPASFTHLAHTQ